MNNVPQKKEWKDIYTWLRPNYFVAWSNNMGMKSIITKRSVKQNILHMKLTTNKDEVRV